MAESDEWEFVEEWYGNPPDEILEGIKQRAKEHIAGVEETINSLDAVVRACKDWERKVLLGLCPECRNTHKRKNKIKPETMYQTHDDKRKSPSLLSYFRRGSGKRKSEIKDKHSSSVDRNGQQSPEKMERSIDALQLQLELKESAYIKDIKTKESENENLKQGNEKLKEENEHIKLRLSSAVKDLEQAQKDRECDYAEKENLQADMTALLGELEVTRKGSTEQISDLTKQLKKQKKQIGELENDLDTKDDELRILKKELAEAKRPQLRDIVLGLRTERSGMGKTMIEMVNRELSGQLQSLLDKDNVRLTVKQCTTATDVQKGLLAVLCLDMSRVGTNIKDALAGIKVNRDVIVIVFHHTSRENLSSLTPTSLRITGSELRQLGAIIDMVFSSDGGIYECDLNSAAVANIASLLTKYS